MKPVIIIPVVIVTIIAIVIGLVAYSYTQIQLSLENVSYQGLDFATPSGATLFKLAADFLTNNWIGFALTLVTGVKLGLAFGLSNHGFFPVYIPDVSYDILVNGIKMGQGQSHISSTINPGETRSFQDNVQDYQFNAMEPAITSIVDAGGMANFQVSGTAYFNFLGINVPVPFQSSKQINVVDEIKNHFSNYLTQNSYQQNQQSHNQITPPSNTQSLEQQLQTARNKINAVQSNNIPPDSITIYPNVISITSHGYKYQISYDIPTYDKITSMQVNYQSISLDLSIQTNSDGTITLVLPRALIDSKTTSGQDDPFFVLIDGVQGEPQSVSSSNDFRTITIPYLDGTKDIEIIGTKLGQ